jgi:spore maturation protein CgeB
MTTPFGDNLAALERRSPAAAARVRAADASGRAKGSGPFSIASASDGSPVLHFCGRPLDSRRNPAEAARREAAAARDERTVVAGLGTGYFAEALLDAGRDIAALVLGDADTLAAAMHARDLQRVLERIPVVFLDLLADPVELVCLKAVAPALVPHGASVSANAGLRELVDNWPTVARPGRPPKVLVVGPVAGGSLETARSTARAAEAVGADVRFLDFASFADGWEVISRLEVAPAVRRELHSRYSDVLTETIVQEAGAWRPDLLLALAQAPLGVTGLRRLREAGIRTAFWFVENFRVLPYWETVAPVYDTFFAIQGEPFLQRLRDAGAPSAFYLPTACDGRRHVPVVLTSDERARFAADVSFAGAPYLNRRRLLQSLADFNPRLWGEGWARTELGRFAADGGRRFNLHEMVRVFAGSRINLNVHSAAHVDGLDPDPDYVNPRTFELAACAAFQLVDLRQPLRQLFSPDEVVSFGSLAELRDHIAHYLFHDEERLAITARARARALGEHTFEHRLREVLRRTLPAPLVAAALLGVKRQTLDDAIRRAEREPVMSAEEAALRVLRQLQEQR